MPDGGYTGFRKIWLNFLKCFDLRGNALERAFEAFMTRKDLDDGMYRVDLGYDFVDPRTLAGMLFERGAKVVLVTTKIAYPPAYVRFHHRTFYVNPELLIEADLVDVLNWEGITCTAGRDHNIELPSIVEGHNDQQDLAAIRIIRELLWNQTA